MPIRPENRKRYPTTWATVIRPAILLRAGNACEGSPRYPKCRARNGEPHPVTGSQVVLTIGHYPDPAPENCEPANVHAWCQKCHNAMDAQMRARNAAATRRAKRTTGQPPLIEEIEER